MKNLNIKKNENRNVALEMNWNKISWNTTINITKTEIKKLYYINYIIWIIFVIYNNNKNDEST